MLILYACVFGRGVLLDGYTVNNHSWSDVLISTRTVILITLNPVFEWRPWLYEGLTSPRAGGARCEKNLLFQ